MRWLRRFAFRAMGICCGFCGLGCFDLDWFRRGFEVGGLKFVVSGLLCWWGGCYLHFRVLLWMTAC